MSSWYHGTIVEPSLELSLSPWFHGTTKFGVNPINLSTTVMRLVNYFSLIYSSMIVTLFSWRSQIACQFWFILKLKLSERHIWCYHEICSQMNSDFFGLDHFRFWKNRNSLRFKRCVLERNGQKKSFVWLTKRGKKDMVQQPDVVARKASKEFWRWKYLVSCDYVKTRKRPISGVSFGSEFHWK